MDKNKRVLQDYKKKGTILIPPIKQIPNVQEVSFSDRSLPNLIWLSALFQNLDDKDAIDVSFNFINEIYKIKDFPNYQFTCLESFINLNDDSKQKIKNSLSNSIRNKIFKGLEHLNKLFPNFPLNFLFEDLQSNLSKEQAISKLKFDVEELLDRRTFHATKVQVTAVFLMMVSGKLDIPEHILSIDDFNKIFLEPNSEGARKVASFARASLNGFIGFDDSLNNDWADSFWYTSFYLDGCSEFD